MLLNAKQILGIRKKAEQDFSDENNKVTVREQLIIILTIKHTLEAIENLEKVEH